MEQQYLREPEFTPQSKGGDFQPLPAIDTASGFRQEAQRQERGLSNYISSAKANDERRLDIANDPNTLQELAQFSKTAFDAVKWAYEQRQKAVAAEEKYDAITSTPDNVGIAPPDVQEDQIKDDLADAEVSASTSNSLVVEQTTNEPALGQQIKNQVTPQAAQRVSQTGQLMKAQANYAPFMTQWMNSREKFTFNGITYTVQDAIESAEAPLIQAALAVGRNRFITQYGLDSVSKAKFVKLLGNTIIQTDAAVGSSVINSAVKSARSQTISEVEGTTYATARGLVEKTSANLQQLFFTQSEQLYLRNTGLTRTEANNKAMQAIVNGLADLGDVESLETLLTINTNPNQPNTEVFRGKLGQIVYKGIEQAKLNRTRSQTAQLAQLEDDLATQLRDAPADERESITRSFIDRIYGIDPSRARELSQRADDYLYDPEGSLTTVTISDQIKDGLITNPDDIEDLHRQRAINDEQRKRLLTELEQKTDEKPSKDPSVKGIIDDRADYFDTTFLTRIGYKKDVDGVQFDQKTDESLVSRAEAEIIIGQARRDLTYFVNKAIRQDENFNQMSERQKEIRTMELSREWYKDNVLSEDGKYYIAPVASSADGRDAANKFKFLDADRRRFKSMVDGQKPNGDKPTISLGQPVYPRQYDAQQFNLNVDGELYGVDVEEYNPRRGDRVFTEEQLREVDKLYKKGVVSPLLQSLSNQLGKTPTQLLNEQIRAYPKAEGLEVYAPVRTIRRTSSSSNKNFKSAAEGAQYLMQQGLPVRGASWLAGNIQQESSWVANRKPWNDEGADAGGLVSWRAGRLRALEQRFRRPVSDISSSEQLDYMLEEMESKYPEAYKIFTNPMASDRDLIRASYIYWVYGDEGARFDYSRQIEQQLR